MRIRASHRSLIAVASVLLGSLSAAPALAQPVANPDSYSTNEDTTLTVGGNGVRSNDNLAGLGNNADAIVLAGPSTGTLNLGQDGNFTYVPTANFNGTVTFTYRLRYALVNFSNVATVTITVNPVNDAPAGVVNRSYPTAEDVPLTISAPGVLAGVTDPDGPVTAAVGTNVPASAGTLSLNPNGGFTFNPAAGFSGNAAFTYRAVDGGGGQSATATVTIAVSSVNDPPVANANSYATTEDIAAFNVTAPGVLGNDTDPDTGSVLTAVLVTSVPASAGTLTFNANGSFTFRPALNFSGITSFTYNARDNATPPATSATPATVTITAAAVNDAPTAVADVFGTTENVPLVVPALGILANDTDIDSSALTALLVATVAPSSGTLSPITTGGFTYTPANGFSGTATFTYRAVDNAAPSAQSAIATVTITVTGVNDAPVATTDVYAATEDTVLTIAAPGVLGNDTDPDTGTTLTALLVAPPTHGSLTLNANGSFIYSPARDYQGPDVFRYRARDNGTPPLQSNEANVTLNVGSVNDPPRFATGVTAIPNQTATEHVALTPLSLAQFFVDPEASPLTFTVTGLPAGLSATPAGVIAGTPAVAATGTFTVNVTISDGQGQFSSTFTMVVLAAGRTDLALSAAATPSPTVVNQTVTWTFTIENRSPVETVANLSLQVAFTGVASFVTTPTPGCTATPQADRTTVACTGGPVLAGSSATIAVAGSSAQPGDVVATATVAIADGMPIDPTPSNDTATTVVNFAQSLPAGPAQTLPAAGLLASANGDFNGDGFIDLAVAAEGGGGTLIYPNVVDPSTSARRALAAQPISLGDPGASIDIAAADLNGDGALDLVVAKALGPSVVLHNPNNGTFAFVAAPNTLGAVNDSSNAVAARDLNGDGRVDVVLGNRGENRVFMNQANGTFAAVAGPLGGDSRDVVLVDLAGDAALELVFANANRGATVHSFDTATNGYRETTLLATGAATSVAAADFDANGRTDLVLGGPQSKLVLLNATAPGAPLAPFVFLPALGVAQTIDVLATDADADGDVDVVGINASGSHQVYTNSGTGQFTLRAQQFASRDARKATAAKLSVDDRVDVAVLGASRLDVFYNDGAGNFGAGDTAAPIIQRRGQASVELTVESVYTDEGATASDSVDGDLTTRIRVDNPVNPAVVGTYTVTYNVVDNSGNAAAPVTRTVRVGVRSGTGGGGGGAFDLVALLVLAGFAIIRGRRPPTTARSVS